MLLHKEAKDIGPLGFWDRMMLFFIGMHQSPQGIQKAVERMTFISADFIEQVIEALNRQIIFTLIADCKERANTGPMTLDVWGDGVHLTILRISYAPHPSPLPEGEREPDSPLPEGEGPGVRVSVGEFRIALIKG
jgi:hypothetical protein